MNGAGNGSAKYLDLLSDLVRKACAAGADTADAAFDFAQGRELVERQIGVFRQPPRMGDVRRDNNHRHRTDLRAYS